MRAGNQSKRIEYPERTNFGGGNFGGGIFGGKNSGGTHFGVGIFGGNFLAMEYPPVAPAIVQIPL